MRDLSFILSCYYIISFVIYIINVIVNKYIILHASRDKSFYYIMRIVINYKGMFSIISKPPMVFYFTLPPKYFSAYLSFNI